MLPNIAFIGRMRSGKDTAFEIIQSNGFNVKRVAYGDVMKEKFYELFPQYKGQPKPTAEIIHFGQSMRVIDPDIWVNLTIGGLKVNDLMRDLYGLEVPSLVFTDVRQRNEYQACQEQGCIFIKIESTEHTRAGRMLQLGEKPNHSIFRANTEEELEAFEYDYLITNNGDMSDFQAQIRAILFDILADKR